MSLMNRNMDSEIETVFLMAGEAYSHLWSTLLRQIAAFGGGWENFPPAVVRPRWRCACGNMNPGNRDVINR